MLWLPNLPRDSPSSLLRKKEYKIAFKTPLPVRAHYISNKLPKLNTIEGFDNYWNLFKTCLLENGYEQSVYFVDNEVNFPLFRREEENILARVLKETLDEGLFHLFQTYSRHASSSLGVLIHLKRLNLTMKQRIVHQLRRAMSQQKIPEIKDSKRLEECIKCYIEVFYRVEEMIEKYRLHEFLKKDEVICIAFNNLEKGQFSSWYREFINNSDSEQAKRFLEATVHKEFGAS